MEEQKKSEGILAAINPLKKKSSSKKVVQDKDAEARAKVEELLKDTSLGSKTEEKPKFDVKEIKQERTSKWLEDQIEMLNKQVEEYENEILYYKNAIKTMQENQQVSNASVSNSGDLNPNIVAFFRHFEHVYESGYTDAKIAHAESGEGVLDLLLQYFPQLQSVRRYRYRGQGQLRR